MMFTMICLLVVSALVSAVPYRFHEPLERDSERNRIAEPFDRDDTFLNDRNRLQEPLDREISMGKLFDENTAFSRAGLDYYLDILNDYKDYVPKEVQMIFRGLSDKTKNEMVATVNDIEQGRVKIPNNVPKIVDYVAKRTPQLGDNIDKAMDTLMTNMNRLSPTAKKGFNMWWNRIFEAVSAPRNMVANRLADLMADFYEEYSKCAPSLKNEIRTIWPEAYNLLESDFAKNFASVARKFADGGLSMDIHLLSADAAYPPKAPKVKITDPLNRDESPEDFRMKDDREPRKHFFMF